MWKLFSNETCFKLCKFFSTFGNQENLRSKNAKMHKNIKRLNIKTHKKFENDFEIKNIVKHATCQCVLYISTSV